MDRLRSDAEALRGHLARWSLGEPTLVLDAEDLPSAPLDGQDWWGVVLLAGDPAAHRRAASLLPQLLHGVRARVVGCVVAGSTAVVPLRSSPLWPPLVDLDARLEPDGVARTLATFRTRLPVAAVLVAMARAMGRPVPTGNGGLWLACAAAAGQRLPPVDPTVAATADPASETPADVVVGTPPATPTAAEVTGRTPWQVGDPAPDDLAVGPLDEALLNPGGFRGDWARPVVDLADDAAADPTPATVARLRDAQGARVDWASPERTVAALAMAGIPLVAGADAGPPPPVSRARLGADLVAVLCSEPDLADPLRREEHSVRLRRAALVRHSTAGWRARLAGAAGVRAPAYPTVSVLLPTRRPDLLDHALRQVARQRRTLPGAEVELVLASHGHDPDRGRVAELLDGMPHTVVPCPADLVFGAVLRRATDAAAGEVVVKMDDDDWYGPDVVTDLLLARRYTGAELVGMPAEMVYLEPIRTTVRRRGGNESYGTFVAGGTMTVDRAVLRGLGGFRQVHRFVDAQLIDAVRAAGGSVYRTCGLGYVLRRTAAGHTWDTGLGYFLRRQAVADQWRGFRPSALLEHPAEDAA